MTTKKTSIIVTIAVIFAVLVYLFLNKQGVDKQIITSTTTIPLVKEINSNIHETIYIGTSTINDSANIKKTAKTKSIFYEKEFMDNFFAKMKNKSFEKRFKAFIELDKQDINLIGYHQEMYDLIISEDNTQLRKQLLIAFFGMYSPNRNEKTFESTKEQHEEIKNLVLKMMLNQEIKDEVVGREFRLLSADEIENIYAQYQNEFNDEHKSALINSYTNNTVLSGKDPYSSNLSTEVEKHISKEKLKKRTQDMLGVLAKSSDGSDVTGSSDFLREQLKEPIAGTDPLHYVLWMQAKVTTFSGYQQKSQFINSQFHKISQPYKHEFILRMPTYAPMVENLYAYLLARERELLQILTDVIRIDDPKVFKALTEFRAIFLFSNNNLRQGIDRIIKQLIDILPDYQVSLDILKFIKDEQVYIPSNNFNIESHIQRISSNITAKKNESDLDTGKIPDDNPL